MKKRLISLMLTLAMILGMLPVMAVAGGTSFGDVKGHWAEAAIVRLSENEVVNGNGGKFRPDDTITRAEVAQIFTNLMGYKTASDKDFSDLPKGAWYTDSMRKAVAAEVFSGSGDGAINPTGNITRQEFFITLARLLKLQDETSPVSFSDAKEIADWAAPKLGALAKAGFLKGTANGDGTFRVEPTRTISRSEVVALLDRAFPGLYVGAEEYTENVAGNTVVRAAGATLTGLTVDGSLFIAPGVGDGEVTLDGVKVPGTTYITGGGKNSVILKGGTQLGTVEASKNGAEAPLTIKVQGTSNITTLRILSGSAKTDVIVDAQGTVDTLIAGNAGSTIGGKGKVAVVQITANDVSVTLNGAKVEVAADITGTMVNGKAVEGGKTVTAKTSTGGGTVPGGGGTPEVPGLPEVPEEGYCRLTFDTLGGAAITPVDVRIGSKAENLPAAKKADAIFLGWYTDAGCTTNFYASEPLSVDTTIYAKYGDLNKNQAQKVDSFALTDVSANKTIMVKAPGLNAEQVKKAITVTNVGAGGTPELTVVPTNATTPDGTFTVSAKGGYREGEAITLNLGDGVSFAEKDSSGAVLPATIRNASFTVAKEEVAHLDFNKDMGGITSDTVKDLKLDVVGGKDQNTGTFTNTDKEKPLEVGALIAIYDEVAPQDRTDPTKDYTKDEITYVKVTDYNTETGEAKYEVPASKEILTLPETLPLDATDFVLASYTGGTDTDFVIGTDTLTGYWKEYGHIGLSEATTIDVGDAIVIFGAATDEVEVTEASTVYGIVKTVEAGAGTTNTTVTFDITTADAIMAAADEQQNYYVKQDVNYEDIVAAAVKEDIPKQIEEQAIASGFAEKALTQLGEIAAKTDTVTGLRAASGIGPNVDISLPSFGEGWDPNVKIPPLLLDGWTVQAKISTNTLHFGDGGLMCQLFVKGVVSVPLSTEPFSPTLEIELTATFQQELKLVVNIDGGIDWQWAAFIPYPADIYMNANVDMFDYTAIKVHATVQTIGGGFDMEEVAGDLAGLKDMNISQEITDLLGMEDAEQMNGTQKLFDMYADMLENETDYVSLVNQEIFNLNIPILGLFKVGVKSSFVIQANVNLVIGSSLEYESGNRYNFWFKLFSGKSGSGQTQLIDEKMKFQFYVMGMIGLRVGLETDLYVSLTVPKDTVGGSIDLASTGLKLESGAYVELYGYFVYTIESLNKVKTSTMSGALYVDFGIYLDLSFVASIGGDALSYSKMLYEKKWPLISAGDRINVFDFTYAELPANEKYVIKNYTTDYLPDSYWSMHGMDLMEGNLVDQVYPRDQFIYTLSNPAFKFDTATGIMNVTVPNNVRYMECDMTVTWAGAKLAFSTGELRRTIHLVWTNLADEEMSLRHNISVVADGKVIWSKVVGEGEQYALPTTEELKVLLDFGKFKDPNGTDLKYTGGSLKYKNQNDQSEKLLDADRDLVYTVDVTPREYTLTINGVMSGDGTTSAMNLKAKYGESFDLTALRASGASAPEAAAPVTPVAPGTTVTAAAPSRPYTVYAKTECVPKTQMAGTLADNPSTEPAPVGGKAIDSVIDIAFAKQLLAGTYNYNAQYNDNFVTATYHFVDSRGRTIEGVEPMEIKVERDTVSTFDYYEYVTRVTTPVVPPVTTAVETASAEDMGAETASAEDVGAETADVLEVQPESVETIAETAATGKMYFPKRFDKEPTKLTSDESYTVVCVLPLGNELEISFTGAGSTAAIKRYNGAHLTLPTPEKEGYVFAGWYVGNTDEAFTDINMPNAALALTAKWTANKYTVHFDVNTPVSTAVSSLPKDAEAVFDAAYKLPTKEEMRRSGYNLGGWTLTPNGAVADVVTNVTTAENHTLYACWVAKELIDADYLEKTPLAPVTYDKQAHPFELKLKTLNPGPVVPTADALPAPALTEFIVQYKGRNPIYSANRWVTFTSATNENVGPVDGETYDVMLYKPESETHQMFKQVVPAGVTINRAPRVDVQVVAPTAVTKLTFDRATVTPAVFSGADVGDGVPTYYMETWSWNSAKGKFELDRQGEMTTSQSVPYSALQSLAAYEYRIYTALTGGRNYEDWSSSAKEDQTTYLALPQGSKPAKDRTQEIPMTFSVEVKTADIKDAGTDSKITFKLMGHNGTANILKEWTMDSSRNDFQRGNRDTYVFNESMDPWMIRTFQFYHDGVGTASGWRLQSTKPRFTGTGLIPYEKEYVENKWVDKQEVLFDLTPIDLYKRDITALSDFAKWGGKYTIDATSTGTIAYTYDGKITDQYGTYDAYLRSDTPRIEVGTLNREGEFVKTPYEHVIKYSNYGFSIDKAALYNVMASAEKGTVTFAVKLNIPTASRKNTDETMFLKTITVNCPTAIPS